jgi:hypothetical protein
MRLPDILDHQVYFDDLVSATNCTDAPDRFECLKQVPFSALQKAVDESPGLFSYQSMKLAWTPMVDGTLIPRNPMQLVESGKFSRVSSGFLSRLQPYLFHIDPFHNWCMRG